MENCYQCGGIEQTSWDLHVQAKDPDESRFKLVARIKSCRNCVSHSRINWGRLIDNSDIPVISYDHDEHTAKMDAYRNR